MPASECKFTYTCNERSLQSAQPTQPILSKEKQFSSLAPPLKSEEVDLTAVAVKDGGVLNSNSPTGPLRRTVFL